jgi:hypothetical protein
LGSLSVKQGPKTTGFAWTVFVSGFGELDRSVRIPRVTVWMSFEDRFSTTSVSPGRTLIVPGKYVPNTKLSSAAESPSIVT